MSPDGGSGGSRGGGVGLWGEARQREGRTPAGPEAAGRGEEEREVRPWLEQESQRLRNACVLAGEMGTAGRGYSKRRQGPGWK